MDESSDKTMAELAFTAYQEEITTHAPGGMNSSMHGGSFNESFIHEIPPGSSLGDDKYDVTHLFEGEYRDRFSVEEIGVDKGEHRNNTGYKGRVSQYIDVYEDGSMVAYMSDPGISSRKTYHSDTVKVVSEDEALEIISTEYENAKAPLDNETLKPLDPESREKLSNLMRNYDGKYNISPAKDVEQVENLRSALKSFKMSLDGIENGMPFSEIDEISVASGDYPSEDPESTINTYQDNEEVGSMGGLGG